jgi:histidine triad (HIT) family protein
MRNRRLLDSAARAIKRRISENPMSLDGAYDDQNIFARLVRGEIPSARIFEDEHVVAFMDAFPQAQGHCLVISKTSRARNLLDVEPQALNEIMAAVQKVARAVREALKPDGILISQFNGSAAGQTVFHLHVHIIPRFEGVPLGRHGSGMADPEELRALAAQIAAKIR